MSEFFQVRLNVNPKQMKQMAKGKPTQIKANQIDASNGVLVSLDKDNYKRYRRAKNQKKGFRVVMTPGMISGSGFADILKGIKSGVSKAVSVAAPYVKNKLKELLPSVRADVDNAINTYKDQAVSAVKSKLNPLLGDQLTNQLVDSGAAKLSNFAKDKLDAVQTSLQGMGLKKVQHYRMTKGGMLKLNWSKIGQFFKDKVLPVVKEIGKPLIRPALTSAATVLPAALGAPQLAPAAGMAVDALLQSQGLGVPVLLNPAVIPKMKVLKAKPKAKAKSKGKKINGTALMPMGYNRGGALFPM